MTDTEFVAPALARFTYQPPRVRTGRWDARPYVFEMEHPNGEDHIFRLMRDRGTFYEIDLLEWLALHAPLGGTYVDVGANVGNHAVFFATFLADYVVAVEPAEDLASALEGNLGRAAGESYCVVQAGAGRTAGRARLYEPAAAALNVGARRLEVDDSRGDVVGTIPVTTLDTLQDTWPEQPVHLIKIDVEGMELDVLRGAQDVLARHRPDLVVELATPAEFDAARAFLAPFGYRKTGRFCYTPTYTFAVPGARPRRKTPARWVQRATRSWRRGAISRWRKRLFG